MLSRNEFKKYMKDIEKTIRYKNDLHTFYRDHNLDFFLESPDCVNSVIELLCKEFNQPIKDNWIDYFVYDLEFGKDYKDGYITDMDGTHNIRMGNVDQLYDFLLHDVEKRRLLKTNIEYIKSFHFLKEGDGLESFKDKCIYFLQRLYWNPDHISIHSFIERSDMMFFRFRNKQDTISFILFENNENVYSISNNDDFHLSLTSQEKERRKLLSDDKRLTKLTRKEFYQILIKFYEGED